MQNTATYSQKIVSSIRDVNEKEWSSVANDNNIYLSLNYLRALELSMGDEIDFFYATMFNTKGVPVLIAVFQLVNFTDRRRSNSQSILKHIAGDKNKNGDFSMNILVCGNVFSDGENGFLYANELTQKEAVNQVAELADQIKKDKVVRKKLSVVLFKEFFPDSATHLDQLKEYNYRDFMIDVNMVLPIHSSWNNIEDYLFSMKTKYRTRAKGVFKKSQSVSVKSLEVDEIVGHEKRIGELFNNVVQKSEYNFGIIKPSAFSAFKRSLGNQFSFKGVFLKNKLIGFSTAFFHKGIMEANYVGIDYDYNQDLAIYQRLLYDYVDQAIENKSTELQLGRTSELIKSSLGAVPVNMKLYAKHKTAISNVLMSSILCFISPSKFELRQPFKADFIN